MVKGRTPRAPASGKAAAPARTPSARRGKRGAANRDWARLALDAASTLTLVVDGDGVVRSCNPACATWRRGAEESSIGERFDAFAEAVGLSSSAEHAARALAGETRRFNTLALRTESGVRMVEATYAPHRTDSGTVAGFVAYLTDVTDRERSAQQRQNAVEVVPQLTEAHYRRLIDISPDPLYVHRNGWIVMVNAAAVRLFGAATPDQLVGKLAFDLVHPDDRKAVRERVARTIGEDAVTTFVEQRRLRLDGSEFDAQVAATPIVLDGQRGGVVLVRDITEQHRAEQRLRESELRFRLLAESSFDAILEIEDGVIRNVYGRAKELLGYGPEELIGMEAKATAAPDAHADVDRRIAQHVEGTYEARSRRKDGTIIPVELSAKHFVRDGLNIRITALRDISARKRAEEKIRDSEERFRHLAEACFDAALVIEDGVIRDVNGRATELYGYGREELIGRVSTMLAPPDQVDRIEQRIRAAVEGTFDTEILRKGGEIVPVEVSTKHFVRDGHGIRISAMRDITVRKRIETQLRESEARFRRLFEMFPYALYVHVDDEIVFVNDKAVDLFGYDAVDQMLGTSALALYHPDFQDYVRRRRAELFDDEAQGPRVEFRFVRRDGTVFDGEGVATPMTWSGRNALVVIVCDISERKKFIQAITAAKETAELANRSKTEFLATVSHELRTPLNAIIGFSDLMVNELLGPLGDAAYKTYATDILASGRHLLGIINDILDISKIEAGKLELADAPFSLRESLLASVKFVEGKAGEKSIDLKWRAALDLPRLRGDEQKFRQILTNLLSNAVKFTPERGSVTATAAVAADGAMVIAVADTGIGIAPDDIEKALTPFVQIESGLDRNYEGTGLGLPISKALAEMHGGTLSIQSAPGRGTSVTVRIPPERVLRETVDELN